MSANNNLGKAKKEKNDEFYTQLTDIEKELKHYKEHFKGKVVYCNCDDPRVSGFFNFFLENFEVYGLKKLISTCYKSQQTDQFSLNDSARGLVQIYEGNKNGGLAPEINNIGVQTLNGDGDFRSEESIEFLKEADIVVTNPPFSLFREYVAQIEKYNKKFLIIGSANAITYKEIFPLIKENKMWLGVNNGVKRYRVPEHSNIKSNVETDEQGKKWQSLGNTYWFTNLEIEKRYEEIILYEKYSSVKYPQYNNYKVINVDKVKEIPVDYDGIVGVPITFLDKYNPNQFEILGIANSARWIGYECFTIIGDRKVYNRILIRNKKVIKK